MGENASAALGSRRVGRNEFQLDPLTSGVTKVGPKLYVEIEGRVDMHLTIADEHRVRQRLFDLLNELSYDIRLNVELLPDDPGSPS